MYCTLYHKKPSDVPDAYLYTRYWKNKTTTTGQSVTLPFVDFTHETKLWRCRAYSKSI